MGVREVEGYFVGEGGVGEGEGSGADGGGKSRGGGGVSGGREGERRGEEVGGEGMGRGKWEVRRIRGYRVGSIPCGRGGGVIVCHTEK